MKVICQIDGQHCGSRVHICLLLTIIDIINIIKPSLLKTSEGNSYAFVFWIYLQQCAAVIWTMVFFRFKYTTFATPLDDKNCHKDDKGPQMDSYICLCIVLVAITTKVVSSSTLVVMCTWYVIKFSLTCSWSVISFN